MVNQINGLLRVILKMRIPRVRFTVMRAMFGVLDIAMVLGVGV